jgi:hypothetical protein
MSLKPTRVLHATKILKKTSKKGDCRKKNLLTRTKDYSLLYNIYQDRIMGRTENH